MKKHFWLDCRTVMDTVYEAEKESSLSTITQMRIGLHLLFCRRCAGEIRNLHCLEDVIKTDFFPPSPDFEDILMKQVIEETSIEEKTDAPTGFSFRLWVIIGFFILLSLSSSFFGMNFINIAESEGLSFLLPVGLTIGTVVTGYGALFIGSHLKELSTRFGLR